MYIETSSGKLEAPRIKSSVEFDVTISVLWSTAINQHYNIPLLYAMSYVTKRSLHVSGNLHGRPSHILTKSGISIIMML